MKEGEETTPWTLQLYVQFLFGVNIVILVIRAGEYDWVVCVCVRVYRVFSPKSERGV